jgi:hypothetical protein
MKIKYPSRNVVLSLYSAITALYCDSHLLSQNNACRNIVLSQYSAGTERFRAITIFQFLFSF